MNTKTILAFLGYGLGFVTVIFFMLFVVSKTPGLVGVGVILMMTLAENFRRHIKKR
jgi:hypothetical protein